MIVFVVNEKSGNGRGRRAWETVKRILTEKGVAYEAIAAGSAEDAVRLAGEVVNERKASALVAVGGDGTLHSLIPLAMARRVPLGLIPAGSGNDTALYFGLPKDPAAALAIVLDGTARPSDVMMTRRPDGTPEYSLISVATGLDGAVAEDVNGSRYKKLCNRLGLGPLAYIIGLFRMLAVYKPRTLTVTVDGVTQEYRRGWLTAVANLPTYGGGLKICPDARADDGLLHACVVHGCSTLQLLLVFPSVLSGKHVNLRFVTMLRGKEIAVESPVPLPAFGDGEPAGHTPVRASILPRQLMILSTDAG